MKTLRLLPLSLAITAALAIPAQAQSLLDLYQSAKTFDANYQSAKSLYLANVARGEQARAGLLPNIGFGLAANRIDSGSNLANFERNYGNQTATLSASQPVYRPANVAAAEQGKKLAELAQAQLISAYQDLIVRVSQAYFDVLAAEDNLALVKAQRTAVSEQLASARRNFEVGTSTITDTREAEARSDLVLAQEIAAENDLRVKKLALDQATGRAGAEPKPLLVPVVLPPILPDQVAPWVAESQELSPAIVQAELNLEIAQLETQKAQAGHKPTLDLIGSYNVTHNNGSAIATQDYRTNVAAVSLSFNLPLFAGFAIQNRVKETVALEEKSRSDLDAATRGVAQNTRAAFFGVQSGLGQVKALEAAEVSSQSLLDATKLGYEVGVRINIDVLNAQTTLFDTKAKLARARYDVLVGELRLRQANGSLKEEDIYPINALLAP
ncbi:TolC family outer membrane protein [Rhodoferax antarcticus]|uniref:Type I secretion outer membrane, TolC family protein n=1 Tax=Rhodoferax antarcticus ANT.BR TaxID=1111071 RepID=A0A1Q8YA15_9BURK|nr:TolC family outer membrane protein [Rhodoferax antarcticus]APW46988.1 channel protein TolC [Rhodoferax antarcticus]MCW2311667.1 outer membrane protein [Rhodoferax antarcticus]OLP04843.1 type I secretion outer membrane, TolC family protein [Rhodoferax antarcticus ANT.BR]